MAFQRCSEITQRSGLEIAACHFFTRSKASLLLPSDGKWCPQSGRLSVHQLAMVSPSAGPPEILLQPLLFLELLGLLQHGPWGQPVCWDAGSPGAERRGMQGGSGLSSWGGVLGSGEPWGWVGLPFYPPDHGRALLPLPSWASRAGRGRFLGWPMEMGLGGSGKGEAGDTLACVL